MAAVETKDDRVTGDMGEGSQAWLPLKQEDWEGWKMGVFGANYSLLGIAEVMKSSYLCTRKIDNISNYE